jgi:hypothetical protein
MTPMTTRQIVTTWLPLALVLSLASLACDQRSAFEAMVPKDDAAFAIETLAYLQRGHFPAAENRISEQARTPALRSQMERLAAVLGTQAAQDVHVIGFSSNTVNGATTYTNVVLEYRFAQRWLVVTVAMHRSGAVRAIDGVQARPTTGPQEFLNRFTLAGKTVGHYVVLVWTIVTPVLIGATLLLLLRTPVPRLKWLWALFVAVGVGQLSLDWTTGDIRLVPLQATLFGSGFLKAGPYSPVVLLTSLPVGAIVFLLLRRRRWVAEPSVPPDTRAAIAEEPPGGSS